jgi:uracil-DNA glycosylase
MNKVEMLQMLDAKVKQCKKCEELVENRTQTVFGVGNPNTKIVLIGEAPGHDEDQQGEPFVGKAGKLLNAILEACGIQRSQIYICNICKCRPPGNRAPTFEESKNCRGFLDLQLKIIAPKYIVCMGGVAAQNLLGELTPISQMRGKWYEYNGIPVLPVFHPAYLLRNPAKKADMWEDLQLLLARMRQD